MNFRAILRFDKNFRKTTPRKAPFYGRFEVFGQTFRANIAQNRLNHGKKRLKSNWGQKIKKPENPQDSWLFRLAEDEGLEPPWACTQIVFKKTQTLVRNDKTQTKTRTPSLASTTNRRPALPNKVSNKASAYTAQLDSKYIISLSFKKCNRQLR